jgi:hypothetical protein
MDSKRAAEVLHWWFDEDHEPEREAVRIRREDSCPLAWLETWAANAEYLGGPK